MKIVEKRLMKNMLILACILTMCLPIMACREQVNNNLEGILSDNDKRATKSGLITSTAASETTASVTTNNSREKTVKKEDKIVEGKGTITCVRQDWYGIVPDTEKGTRYAPVNLAEEFKVDKLRVYFKGKVGEVPPNVRMWGTPLVLIKIRKLDSSSWRKGIILMGECFVCEAKAEATAALQVSSPPERQVGRVLL